MKKTVCMLIASLVCLLVVLSVGADTGGDGDRSETANSIPIKRITVQEKNYILAPGTRCVIRTTIEPQNVTNSDLLWYSSNEKVAIVDEYGIVYGISNGSATITVAATDGSNVKAKVRVSVEMFDIVFTENTTQFAVYYCGNGYSRVSGTIKTGNALFLTGTTHMEVRAKSISEEIDVSTSGGGYSLQKAAIVPETPGVDNVTIKVNRETFKYRVFVSQEVFPELYPELAEEDKNEDENE